MNENQIPQTLIELLECYSPTGQEYQAVERLTRRMSRLGYTKSITDAAGNAVGLMGDGPNKIILLGHIDTVPGNIEVRQVGDLLYGRGSVDAKGPLSAFVDAVAAVGVRKGWQYVVIGAVEEEGGSKGARFIVDHDPAQMVIIGEPSRWDRITLGYKGSVWTEIHNKIPTFHTAGKGMSACEQLIENWEKILKWSQEFNQNRHSLFSQVQPTLRALASGENDFEEWAMMRVGVRIPENFLPQQWVDQLIDLCGESKVEITGYPLPAYKADKNNILVRQFLQAIRKGGGSPNFVYKSGTSDFNLVGHAWDCPIVAYGPGDSSLDHTPEEHISIPEYYKSVDVLKEVLTGLSLEPRIPDQSLE